MSRSIAALSMALGVLTSLAVPGACVALDTDPAPSPRDIASDGGSLFVIGRASLPGLEWVSVCREARLVNDVPLPSADAVRAASDGQPAIRSSACFRQDGPGHS